MCGPFQQWAAAPWPDCRHARLAFGVDFRGFDLPPAAGVEQHEIYESSLGLLEMLAERVAICPQSRPENRVLSLIIPKRVKGDVINE